MRFGLHVVGQNNLPHFAVGHDHHVFGRGLEPGGAPIDFDHLADDMGFTPVLVNHDPVTNSKRLLDVHRKADEYAEIPLLRAIPTTMLRTPDVAQIPVTD